MLRFGVTLALGSADTEKTNEEPVRVEKIDDWKKWQCLSMQTQSCLITSATPEEARTEFNQRFGEIIKDEKHSAWQKF